MTRKFLISFMNMDSSERALNIGDIIFEYDGALSHNGILYVREEIQKQLGLTSSPVIIFLMELEE